MKIYAYHDPQGHISSLLAVNAPEGITLTSTAKRGELVSEIEADDFAELSGTSLISKLRETLISSIVAPQAHALRPYSED